MAVRNDISVDWSASPRIITVAKNGAASEALTIQDLHDTVRDLEDELPAGMSYPHLINSAGKESLGGGTFVGITVALQNAKLAFEARGGPSFTTCVVSGGNITAVDENGSSIDPIQTTDYTQVVISQSSSPTLIEAGSSGMTLGEFLALS